MSKKQLDTRVEALEKRSGGGDTRIIVCWSTDDSVIIDDEVMSRDEALKRYPDMIFIEWSDDEQKEAA